MSSAGRSHQSERHARCASLRSCINRSCCIGGRSEVGAAEHGRTMPAFPVVLLAACVAVCVSTADVIADGHRTEEQRAWLLFQQKGRTIRGIASVEPATMAAPDGQGGYRLVTPVTPEHGSADVDTIPESQQETVICLRSLDDNQARRALYLAAFTGNADAQGRLASMYFHGDRYGILQDYDMALFWAMTAAIAGSVEAQAAVGWMFGFGNGVEVDRILGYAYLSIAALHDPEAYDDRELLGEQMTIDEIREAQTLSRKLERIIRTKEYQVITDMSLSFRDLVAIEPYFFAESEEEASLVAYALIGDYVTWRDLVVATADQHGKPRFVVQDEAGCIDYDDTTAMFLNGPLSSWLVAGVALLSHEPMQDAETQELQDGLKRFMTSAQIEDAARMARELTAMQVWEKLQELTRYWEALLGQAGVSRLLERH